MSPNEGTSGVPSLTSLEKNKKIMKIYEDYGNKTK
jgi:hypothetical protein